MNAVTRGLAIVTGASSGIGFELARECAKMGSISWSPQTGHSKKLDWSFSR